MKITFGSVCSGIEAASVAWHPLGWRAAWLAEIEPFPSFVLHHHYGSGRPLHMPSPDEVDLSDDDRDSRRLALKSVSRLPDTIAASAPRNLGDFTRIAAMVRSGAVAAPDVLIGGTPCFTAGHMVLCERGYIPIELLVPGDLVMTHLGRLRRVVRVGSKQADVGKLSGVGLQRPITCTAEHPFLSVKWSSQSTKRSNVYTKVEHCGEPEWTPASDMAGRQWCALTTYETQPKEILSSKFSEKTAMYVAGMFVGDGWVREFKGRSKKAVMLGINPVKYEKLLAVIGNSVHSAVRECTSVKVAIYDTKLANWLTDNFGKYSHLKNLPSWILGHEHRAEFLRGFLDADGCTTQIGKISVSTTSEALAYGINDLLIAEGHASSVGFVKTPCTCVIQGRTVNQRNYYQIRAFPQSKSRKSRARHGFLLRAATAFEPTGSETVFNIEVEEDHSYILNGAVVHNCQAFSIAGLRNSLDDARGQLTLAFVDLANAIDSTRLMGGKPASIIVWENVFGVLSTKDNAFGCFLGALAGEDCALVAPGGKWPNAGCVYGPQRTIAWRVTDAQYFGVPQRRRRVFVVASARDGFDPTEILFEFDGVRRDTAPSRQAGQDAAGTVRASAGRRGGVQDECGLGLQQVESDSGVICMAHGQGGAEIARERRTTLTCNHEAPIVAAPVTRNVERPRADGLDMPIAFSSKDYGGDACYDLSPTLRAGNHAGSHANAGSPPGIAYMADDYKNGTFEQCDTARTLTTSAYRTRAAPIVCTGVIGALGTSSREDGTGRGQPIVAAPSYSICLGSDPINALELAQPITRRNGDPGTITTGMAVRRLTPVECERLQAFPDFYTLIPMGIVSASRAETIRVKGDPVEFIDGAWWKLSVDGPRYKALGNSMCTNNIAWIGRRIELALARQMVAAA